MNSEVSIEGILNLIEKIYDLYQGIVEGRITICIDILKNIVYAKMKLSQCIFNCRVICSRIKEILEQIKVHIVFEYLGRKSNVNEEFRYDRGAHLMKICNEKSKEI